jgi:hypothetical protein
MMRIIAEIAEISVVTVRNVGMASASAPRTSRFVMGNAQMS